VTITEEEVRTQLRKMKNGRAPGPGNIPIELIKHGGCTIINRLTRLVNVCYTNITIPQAWRKSYLVSIFKKGNRKDPGCYRGISVLSSIARLFGKILNNQLNNDMKGNISEEQSGFMSGRSCVDNLFILQQLTQKRISIGEELLMTFIDLEKAYDQYLDKNFGKPCIN
jgi:Reverse transcriptase (RNA-dependent DNA polymerase)